jgi:hypothetical protein
LFKGEWICGDHWRLVDRGLKAAYRKQLRKLAKRYEKAAAFAASAETASVGSDHTSEAYHRAWDTHRKMGRARRRYWAADGIFWFRIKRQATERASGI